MSTPGDAERNTTMPHSSRSAASVLRFSTAGSVDDGKSTLIGRLLHDTQQIHDDQLRAIAHASSKRGSEDLDLSLLTDGLEAEREQGITIDVAYRYFTTAQRKYIIADTPGHRQYTRNMATGASTADAALILVDATRGLLEQGKRHLYIAHLLGIRHIAVAINKMDLVDYRRDVFASARAIVHDFARSLEGSAPTLTFVPVSALRGDMVVERGERMTWHDGPTLLEWLESIEPAGETSSRPLRFPVQLVQRTQEGRTYLGRVASGTVVQGQAVTVLPSGRRTRVKRIQRWPDACSAAFAGDSVALSLSDELDVSRGDYIVDAERAPAAYRALDATLVWLSSEPLVQRARYLLKHTSRTVAARVVTLRHVVEVETLEKREPTAAVAANDIANVELALQQPLFFDSYSADRATGAFILIDEATNQTVAAGMIA